MVQTGISADFGLSQESIVGHRGSRVRTDRGAEERLNETVRLVNRGENQGHGLRVPDCQERAPVLESDLNAGQSQVETSPDIQTRPQEGPPKHIKSAGYDTVVGWGKALQEIGHAVKHECQQGKWEPPAKQPGTHGPEARADEKEKPHEGDERPIENDLCEDRGFKRNIR